MMGRLFGFCGQYIRHTDRVILFIKDCVGAECAFGTPYIHEIHTLLKIQAAAHSQAQYHQACAHRHQV